MNEKLLVDTAVLAGELLLSSGAETYRIEDTMTHILKTSKCEIIEPLALLTGIVVTMNDQKMEQPITIVKTVNARVTNLNQITKVNDISRKYCAGLISLEEAYEELQCVREKQFSRLQYNIATVGISVGFAMMFGGNLHDVVAAGIVGTVLTLIILLGKVSKMEGILINILSGIGIAVATLMIPSVNRDVVIVSAMMPIVPGVAITNAFRDILQGDYLSGCARILEAFFVATAVAVGVGLGMIGGLALWQ